jgi:hypothetical protein
MRVELALSGKSSWPAEKSSLAMSIALGVLVALARFTLVLTGLAWFMPKFLQVADSRWAPLLPAISVLFISASGLVRYLCKPVGGADGQEWILEAKKNGKYHVVDRWSGWREVSYSQACEYLREL